MGNDLKQTDRGAGLPTLGSSKRLLDTYDQALTKTQQRELAPKVAEEQLKLEVKEREAALRFHGAGADIERHKDLVRDQERNKSDFEVKSSFESASGRTDIRVSRANNTLYIVIAVVVAIVFFALFAQ